MAYRSIGDGPPVVLVHGNFASHRWWADLLDAPPEGLRIVAPDLPGFGASPAREGPITIERYADALLRFVDVLDLGPVVWAGHSLGGAVAQAAACAAPARTRGLVLVDSAPPGGFPTPEERYPLLASMRHDTATLRAALSATVVSPATPTPPASFDALVVDAAAMDDRGFTENARALDAMDLEPAIAALDASFPVLVLRGAHDPIIRDVHAEATVAAWPDARLETWDDAGHSPQLEHPERFAERLANFLSELP